MEDQNTSKSVGKLFTLDFIMILMLTIINSTTTQALNSNLPVFIRSLGAQNLAAGLVVTVYMVMAIGVRPIWGYLSDVKSRRSIVLIGTIVVALAVTGYSLVFTVPLILMLRALHGIGFSANTNTTATMAADVIPKHRLSEGIGYYGLANVVATAIGPPAGIYLVTYFGFHTLFEVLGIVSFLCIGAAYLIRYEKKLPPKPVDRPKAKFALYEKTALPISTILLFITLGTGALNSFIQLIAIDRGIEHYSVYFWIYAASLLVTRLFVGRICDKYGPAKVLYPALASLACAFVAFAFAHSLPMFLLAGVFYGLGFGSAQPMLNALMIKRCPPEKLGLGNSTFYIAMDAGQAIGASIAGAVSQFFGFTALYLFCELYVVTAIYLLTRYLKRQSDAPLGAAEQNSAPFERGLAE
ncbi:MFS transporter [Paenibacillus thalictri]|uniref:MFS transporter n=1 Tax=Paenibacillus thalictri TaxID=2527873 RepID=A0A4Q9DM67_9BACL|nr:MFS transporter [Paenibacillus thalictri]TBL76332.1 MFS transporter [Paenibacillus thalictri]